MCNDVQTLYLCDPKKNKNCRKTSCYADNRHPEYGECKWTTDPKCSKDGKEYFYHVGHHKVILK
jgi:hypothetical protein